MKKYMLALSLALAAGGLAVAADVQPEQHDPGSLKAIMVGLGQDMSALNMALWSEDLEAVSASAMAVADHPHVSPEEVARVQATLGEDFIGFAKADKAVHDAGVRLSEAAKAGDMDKTLVELSALQTGCVACHTGYRERLGPRAGAVAR